MTDREQLSLLPQSITADNLPNSEVDSNQARIASLEDISSWLLTVDTGIDCGVVSETTDHRRKLCSLQFKPTGTV